MSCEITQEEFAEKIDVSLSYYQKLERGVRTCSLDILVSIAEHLNVSTDYLLTGKRSSTKEIKKHLWNLPDCFRNWQTICTSTICASSVAKVAQPVRVGCPLKSVQYAYKQNPKPES